MERQTHCRSCGAPELKTFLSLGETPLADALLHERQLSEPEPRYPLDVAVCLECTLVQILATVPPEILYCRDYPYFSSFADALLEHSRRHALRLIEQKPLTTKSLVVEVASNDGYLLKNFLAQGIPVLGIDPAEGPARVAEQAGIPTLREFFGRELAARLLREGKAADVILANNVLAHVPDLNGFVAGLATLLKPDGVAVIEVPYVRELINHCEFDTIYHEHLCYFSVGSVMALCRRHGLTLQHVEHVPIHGGSLRLHVGRDRVISTAVKDDLEDELHTKMNEFSFYQDFAARVAAIKQSLTAMLGELKRQGKRIAAYGAAAKGATLLNTFGIGRDLLDYVVDRNVHKQGRYMPGVRLRVEPPDRLLADRPEYVLLLAWNFRDEILAQQEAFRRGGGKFIVPIPAPVIV